MPTVRGLDRPASSDRSATGASRGRRVLFAPASPRPLRPDPSQDLEGYRDWARAREQARLSGEAEPPADPEITVLLVIHDADAGWLERCLRSVTAQTSDHWHLSVTVVGAGDPEIDALLHEELAGLPRERVELRMVAEDTGEANALAQALDGSASPACLLLAQDDQLAPDAVALMANALIDADVVYGDEDYVDEEGSAGQPRFKPDWSPELCLSWDYTGHPFAFRVAPVVAAGGIRPLPNGDWEHDLVLRVTERTSRVAHVPEVLCHRRESRADDRTTGPGAVAAALERRGEHADVLEGPLPSTWSVRRRPAGRPTVSVVVPFRDSTTLLRACIDSVVATAGEVDLDLVLVDNGSSNPETLTLVDRLSARPEVTVHHDPRPFNWPVLNNAAADLARGEVLLFLNDDVEAQAGGWLSVMVAQALRPEVGAVGARLLYPGGGLQHGGVAIGLFGVTGHLLAGLPSGQPGYLGMAVLTRDVSAVTGACMATRRDVFDRLGRFDESLGLEFNDIDYCLRARSRGLSVVYEASAELVHHESPSRGTSGNPENAVAFVARWHELIRDGDPFLNKNLSRADFSAALPGPDEGR